MTDIAFQTRLYVPIERPLMRNFYMRMDKIKGGQPRVSLIIVKLGFLLSSSQTCRICNKLLTIYNRLRADQSFFQSVIFLIGFLENKL